MPSVFNGAEGSNEREREGFFRRRYWGEKEGKGRASAELKGVRALARLSPICSPEIVTFAPNLEGVEIFNGTRGACCGANKMEVMKENFFSTIVQRSTRQGKEK